MINESIFGTQQFNGSSALIREYAAAIALTALVTIASYVLEPLAGHAAVSSLYLLLVVVAGLKFRRGPVLFVAATSALAWYTVFIPPRFAFHIGTLEDAMIFTTFLAVAMAMGHLTSRLRTQRGSGAKTRAEHGGALRTGAASRLGARSRQRVARGDKTHGNTLRCACRSIVASPGSIRWPEKRIRPALFQSLKRNMGRQRGVQGSRANR